MLDRIVRASLTIMADLSPRLRRRSPGTWKLMRAIDLRMIPVEVNYFSIHEDFS